MSTLAQVHQLARPFVARHDDLALIKREIVVLPVHHFSRSIHIDRTSAAGEIQPFWQVRMLFAPPTGAGAWSDRLFCLHVDDRETANTFNYQIRHCLDTILRPTRDVEALKRMPRLATTGRLDLSPLQECLISAARGFFAEAADGLAKDMEDEDRRSRLWKEHNDLNYRPNGKPWQKAMKDYNRDREHLAHLGTLHGVLKTGQKHVIAGLFNQWERAEATKRGLGHLWQPTPFPFEGKQYRGASAPTTATDAVRKWIAPMLKRRPELTLVDRRLVIKPIGHLLRGVHFDASPAGIELRPRWFINVACSVPANAPYHFARKLIGLESTSENFERLLEWYCEHAIDARLKSMDLAALLEGMEAGIYDNADAAPGIYTPSEFRRATMLAALGRFDEAVSGLRDVLPDRRARHEARLKADQRLLAKTPGHELSRYRVDAAAEDLAAVAQMERLLARLEAGDCNGVAGLLREWERINIKAWGVAHLWEPGPFPLEQGIQS